jgi:hypothetical protein
VPGAVGNAGAAVVVAVCVNTVADKPRDALAINSRLRRAIEERKTCLIESFLPSSHETASKHHSHFNHRPMQRARQSNSSIYRSRIDKLCSRASIGRYTTKLLLNAAARQ